MKKTCISRAGNVLFILQAEFKTLSVPKMTHKKEVPGDYLSECPGGYEGSLWLCLGLGQQLCVVLAGICQTSHFKQEINFSGPEKRRIWYVALPSPQNSTHMLCVPCCNLWDAPLSLVCPSRICRELCVQVRLQVLLQQHTSGAEVSRLMRGVQDSQIGILYYPATLPYSFFLSYYD